MYRIITCDLDETLISLDHTISELDREANAVEDLKSRCGYVRQATCDQSTMAEVVERFVPAQGPPCGHHRC